MFPENNFFLHAMLLPDGICSKTGLATLASIVRIFCIIYKTCQLNRILCIIYKPCQLNKTFPDGLFIGELTHTLTSIIMCHNSKRRLTSSDRGIVFCNHSYLYYS